MCSKKTRTTSGLLDRTHNKCLHVDKLRQWKAIYNILFIAHQRHISLLQCLDRLPALISSCHTLTFCSLCFTASPFRSLSTRPTRSFVPQRAPAETPCVLAGSSSQLRDKAPLHTANSSVCVPPSPSPSSPAASIPTSLPSHRNTHIQSFPPKVLLCY